MAAFDGPNGSTLPAPYNTHKNDSAEQMTTPAPEQARRWPVFTLRENGMKIAPNPALVTGVYQSTDGVTEIYTMDCSRADDAWDVKEPFYEVLDALSTYGHEILEAKDD